MEMSWNVGKLLLVLWNFFYDTWQVLYTCWVNIVLLDIFEWFKPSIHLTYDLCDVLQRKADVKGCKEKFSHFFVTQNLWTKPQTLWRTSTQTSSFSSRIASLRIPGSLSNLKQNTHCKVLRPNNFSRLTDIRHFLCSKDRKPWLGK